MEYGLGFADETYKLRESFEAHLQDAYPGCRVIFWTNGLIPSPGACCCKIQFANGQVFLAFENGQSYKDAINSLIALYNDKVNDVHVEE